MNDSDTNIEELISSFNNSLNLEENVSGSNINPNNMANNNEQINIQMLKLTVDLILPYDGNNATLIQFIENCQFLIDTYSNVGNVVINNYILRAIRSKLVGRANLLVGCRTELDNWNLLKDALEQCFGDKRSLECLEQDLLMAHPFKNESTLDFARRLQVLKSHLVQRINSFSVTEMPVNTKEIYRRQYDQMALKTLIRNLTGLLQQTIRIKNPASIEAAITFIIEEDNFNYSQNNFKFKNNSKTNINSESYNRQVSNNHNHHSSYTGNPNQLPRQQFQQSPQTNFNYRNQNPIQNSNDQINNYINPNQFPNQPIQIQPRQMTRNYPTNRQVFGPPKNVFAPTGKAPENRPEPMSINSRNTFKPNQSNNYFRSTNPRNFISQELHQIQTETDPLDSNINYPDFELHPYNVENQTHNIDPDYINPATYNDDSVNNNNQNFWNTSQKTNLT